VAPGCLRNDCRQAGITAECASTPDIVPGPVPPRRVHLFPDNDDDTGGITDDPAAAGAMSATIIAIAIVPTSW
jgi:hypothetical protein